MPSPRIASLVALVVAVLTSSGAHAQSLRGSSASLDRQNVSAKQHDYTYLRDPDQVDRFARSGLLVRLPGNADYRLHAVSFPYARPAVKVFVERLARQYRTACGEQLVVTSLTRPSNRQPANASDRSVHPTGMAIDLRRSLDGRCRRWLETTLLQLERSQVIEATRERWPPHYHIAVFPDPYTRYVARLRTRVAKAPAPESVHAVRYVVKKGDSLWGLARSHGTTVERLQEENRLDEASIYAGQVLTIPARQ